MPAMVTDRRLIEVANSHREPTISLARKSDCLEANYGARIFRGDEVLGEGNNHVPDDIKGTYLCKDCPRYEVNGLRGGVGSELCVAIHAEQAAISHMLYLPNERGNGASMLIEKVKNGELVVRTEIPRPRCVECAKQIYNMTLIKQVIFPIRIEGIDTFVSFSRDEFHRLSIQNLTANWAKTFPSLGIRHR